MSKSQSATTELDSAIDDLAVKIEQEIEVGREFLDELPEFEPRRKTNTVQLRKVIEGDMSGLVTNDK